MSELIDVGVKLGIVQKSGAWFNYGDIRLGQGRDNAKQFLRDNPEIAIAIAVEKGGAGATLSPVARKIVDYYFTFQSSANTVENAYSLLK